MSGIAMENKDMIPIPGAGKFEVTEIELDQITMKDIPAEIYEPVQTLRINKRCCEDTGPRWQIVSEEGKEYDITEFYCNVPTSTAYNETFPADILAVGRLTISGGVAYVDVG